MSKSKIFTFLLIFLSFSAIFSFYNFDSASAQGVTWTYNADTNTATASGSGNTNFAELVQADIDGGWGGVYTADESGTQIICRGKIIVGDGTNALTWADADKQVLFSAGCVSGNSQVLFYVSNNAVVTFGTLQDATNKVTYDGVQFVSLENTYMFTRFFFTNTRGTLYLYSCVVNAVNGGYGTDKTHNIQNPRANDRIWNCILNGVKIETPSCDVFNTTIENSRHGVSNPTSTFTCNQIVFNYCRWAIAISATGLTFNNIYARNCGVLLQIGSGFPASATVNIVNMDSGVWNFDGWDAASDDQTVYRKYTFNLNVLNGNITDFVANATVQLWKDSNLVYEGYTNSSGMIPTQTLTYGYYQQSTGNNIQNATSPFYLVVTHPDWQTYVSRFYITEPLRLTVSMQEPTYTGYTEVEKSDYTTIILFVISLILSIIGIALTVPLLPLISLTISVLNIIFLSEPSIFNILLIGLNVTFTLIALVRAKTKNN